jgi:LAS superfamily LD-carboxypeptidase LdcB
MKSIIYLAALLMLTSCAKIKSENNRYASQQSDSAVLLPTKHDISQGKGEILTSVEDSVKNEISTPTKEYLTGQMNYSKEPNFVKLDPAHCNGRTIYVRTEVAEAFEQMRKAALKDSVVLIVLSGARSFDQQKAIWERKWNNLQNQKPGEKALTILKYSSMPGSSRHHWGTDIDLNSLENNYFDTGKGLKIYRWMVKHASEYGFCQVYTDKHAGNRTGYEMERWHWSYMPLSRHLLEQYNKIVKISDFKGFAGWETASEVQIIEKYVNGIEE